ncbi:ABC transporter substrate-binding protein [Aeromicrobium endophyticum]|uniref:Amino acid ABC transporter substrate-binding protein n=1 Tax=Aeromicrobium endophyticum TaxID=2292704 RepID=A0A371P9K1_9ACTN|nr:ABC transporter substrate-binding protein [Aeromicrobium endophyticum]REK72218.1 amino acid ABC transporter substrate-binding protein [Aeromicrobium endophyticum]
MKTQAMRRLGVVMVAALALAACGGSGDDEGSAVDASCKPAHDIKTVKKGVLTVALTNTPPYSFEENKKIAGIDSAIATDLAKRECLKVEFAPYTYATAIPAVKTGRADVAVGGFYRTAERAEQVTLSEPAYLDEMTVMSDDGASTVDDFSGKKVGTVEGYLWVDALKKLDGVETRVYPDSGSLANDLKSGRLDIGIDGYGAASISAKGTDLKLEVLEEDPRVPATSEPSQTAMLLDPKNDALASALNDLLESLRSDGGLAKILKANGLPASAADVGPARLI